jgi:chromosome segregation ATPase
MLATSAWADRSTLWGQFLNNVVYYPTIDLQLKDLEREVKRLNRRCEVDAERLVQDEREAMQRFKKANARGADREELKHLARIVSSVRARRRLKLKYHNQYAATLQEIDSVRALKDQTAQVKGLARICKRINVAVPMHAAWDLEREYSKAKEQIRDKAEMMEEVLADEDEEAGNKIQDADALVDSLLDEMNLRVAGVHVPLQPPASLAPVDVALLERLDRLETT